jgi:hypothetical protein
MQALMLSSSTGSGHDMQARTLEHWIYCMLQKSIRKLKSIDIWYWKAV